MPIRINALSFCKSKMILDQSKLSWSEWKCLSHGSKSKIQHWKVILGKNHQHFDPSKTIWTGKKVVLDLQKHKGQASSVTFCFDLQEFSSCCHVSNHIRKWIWEPSPWAYRLRKYVAFFPSELQGRQYRGFLLGPPSIFGHDRSKTFFTKLPSIVPLFSLKYWIPPNKAIEGLGH